MALRHTLLTLAAVSALTFGASEALAAKSVWVHGRTPSDGSGCTYTPTNWSYWGATKGGVNPTPVNYNGRGYVSSSNGTVRAGLDANCTGANWCYLAVHSAGAYHVQYALDLYGTNADGSRRWNVYWTDGAGIASGGSELADLGSWTQGDCLVEDLKTGVARSKYNHNNMRGVTFYLFAGAEGGAQAGLLDGEDDGAVPFHSATGQSSKGSWGVPESCDDWWDLCSWPVAAMGSGNGKYTSHSLYWRDDGTTTNHGETINPMNSDMVATAR